MLGFCSNPDCNAQTMDLAQKGPKRFLTNYRNHWVELDNKTIMRVGVCVNCKERLVSGNGVQEIAEKILRKHKEYWADDPHAPTSLQNVSIVAPNGNEKNFLEKRRREKSIETDNLQKQKDDFEKNHEAETTRMEKGERDAEEKEEKRALEEIRKWNEFDPETLPNSTESERVKN